MGLFISKLTEAFEAIGVSFGNRHARIVMVGLDAAGKTTILYKLKLNETVQTLPTIGFNVETIQHQHLTLTVWDIGGQHKIRPLWRHYYTNTDAIIFVVDSSDRERMFEAETELQTLLTASELEGVRVLILANKQDLPNALSANEVAEKLGLYKQSGARLWHVQPCNGKTGEGLVEGLQELAKMLKNKPTGASSY